MRYAVATIIAVLLSLAFSLTFNPEPAIAFLVGMLLGVTAILGANLTDRS